MVLSMNLLNETHKQKGLQQTYFIFQRSKDIKKSLKLLFLNSHSVEKKVILSYIFFSGMKTKKPEKRNLLFVLRNICKIVILKQPGNMFSMKKFQEIFRKAHFIILNMNFLQLFKGIQTYFEKKKTIYYYFLNLINLDIEIYLYGLLLFLYQSHV